MLLRNKIITVIVVFAAGAAAGRFTVPKSTVTQSNTNTQVERDQQIDKNKTVTTVTTEEKAPDGTIKKRTEVVENSTEKKNTETKKSTEQENKTEVITDSSKLTVGLLLGVNYSDLSKAGLMPGILAMRPLLGPVVLGGWVIPQAATGGIFAGLQF